MSANNHHSPPRTTPIHHRRSPSDTPFVFSTSSSMEEEEEEEFLLDMDSINLSSLDILSPPPPQIVTPEERREHRRTNSMDGGSCWSSIDAGDGFVMIDGVKKAMPPEQLAQLALLDPKRAKRIIANRQSAARSKERKVRYTCELERKVQTLQTEATTLSAQVTLLQRDTSVINAENKELLLRLQALEEQAQLRDALNEALTHEVTRLRIETGEPICINSSSGRGQFSQFPPQLPNLAQFGGPQNQQHQFPTSNQNQPSPGHRELKPNFMDFNRKL